jgi:flagellar biogenesis protein FliO
MTAANTAGLMVQALAVLVVVCAGAYLLVRLLGRLPGAGGEPLLRVVARLPLEPRRTLYVVEAAGKTLLVGTTEGGPMATLAELDAEAVQKLVAARPAPRPLWRR